MSVKYAALIVMMKYLSGVVLRVFTVGRNIIIVRLLTFKEKPSETPYVVFSQSPFHALFLSIMCFKALKTHLT